MLIKRWGLWISSPRIDWVRSQEQEQQDEEEEEDEEEECLRRSEFIKDSSNMDELRVSSLLLQKPVLSEEPGGGMEARCERIPSETIGE